MTWSSINIDTILKYTNEWRTRNDIKEKFDLSAVQSWHCSKFISKLPEIMVRKGVGGTGKAYEYKTREYYLKELEN